MDIRAENNFVCSVCGKKQKFMFGTYVGVNYTCNFSCARIKQEEHYYYAVKELKPTMNIVPPSTIVNNTSNSNNDTNNPSTPPGTPKRGEIRQQIKQ